MKDEIAENESQANDENAEDKILNENESNELEDDSIMNLKNDGYADIPDDNST